MISFREINSTNLIAMKNLLYQRNRTIDEYVEWKYGPGSPSGFRGVIVFNDGEEVGCFGTVPKMLVSPGGQVQQCLWFADWFVKQEYQGKGLGRDLLHALKENSPIIFGHPGTKGAQVICKKEHFLPILFQKRYRFITRPWKYACTKSNHAIKRAALYANYWVEGITSRLSGIKNRNIVENCDGYCFASTPDEYEWMARQPTTKKITRKLCSLNQDNLRLIYYEDKYENYCRWIILKYQSTGKERYKSIYGTIQKQCLSVEFFTTNKKVSQHLARLGGIKIEEPPIIVYGLDNSLEMNFHGWDRENFSFVATR